MGRADVEQGKTPSSGRPPVDPAHFVAAARFLELYDPVVEHLASRAATVATSRSEGWAAAADELQAEADAFRRALGLHRAQAMTAWLSSIGYSLEEFEEEMEYRIARRKKRASFTQKEVEACFRDQRGELDRARISQLVVAKEAVAREIVEQVSSENADFAKLAARHSADDDATRDAGGYVGWVRRRDLLPEVAARIFAAPAGRCVAPIKLPDGTFQVVLVHETRTAALDKATEEELRDLLLSRWLGALAGRA
jgi:peptidylprolyl isomerase